MIPLRAIKTCKHCGDFLIWIDDRWLCPTCDKDLIKRLKYKRVEKEFIRAINQLATHYDNPLKGLLKKEDKTK